MAGIGGGGVGATMPGPVMASPNGPGICVPRCMGVIGRCGDVRGGGGVFAVVRPGIGRGGTGRRAAARCTCRECDDGIPTLMMARPLLSHPDCRMCLNNRFGKVVPGA